MNDILKRIRALLNLTEERGATENEAANAAVQVQRLLLEHNLSIEDVKAAGSSDPDNLFTGYWPIPETGRPNEEFWRSRLIIILSRTMLCEPVRWKDHKTFAIIGTKENVVATLETADWLVEQFERLAEESTNGSMSSFFTFTQAFGTVSVSNNWVGYGSKINYVSSFLVGIATRVAERLDAEFRKVTEETESATSFVLTKKEDLRAKIEEALGPPDREFEPEESQDAGLDPFGCFAGQVAGEKVKLKPEKSLE